MPHRALRRSLRTARTSGTGSVFKPEMPHRALRPIFSHGIPGLSSISVFKPEMPHRALRP